MPSKEKLAAYATLIGMFGLLIFAATWGSKPAQQAPKINAQRQTNQSPEANRQPQPHTRQAEAPTVRVPKSPTDNQHGPASTQANHHSEEASEFWTIFGRRMKITDTLLVGVTCLLFLATGALWWSTRDLVKGAERTAERQLRAYVGLHGGSVVISWSGPGSSPIPSLHVSLVLKNAGLTPGHNLMLHAEAKVDNLGARPFHPGPGEPSTRPRDPRTIISPSSTHDVAFDHITTAVGINAVRAGTGAIFVWGRADYVDVFQQPRWFIFRLRMTGTEQTTMVGGVFAQGWPLAGHPEGHIAN